jgi:effector-binding domain-containing protein
LNTLNNFIKPLKRKIMKTKFSSNKTFVVLLVMASFVFQTFAQTTALPKIEVKDIAAQKAVTIKVTVPSKTITQKMGELYGKLFAYLGSNNLQAAGAPFAVYYSYDPKGNTEFEVGLPIGSAVNGNNEIKYKEYPAMKVLSALHIGSYESTAPVYEALIKYAKDNKLQTQPATWEVYLTDPSQEADTAKYRTLIYYVIK